MAVKKAWTFMRGLEEITDILMHDIPSFEVYAKFRNIKEKI